MPLDRFEQILLKIRREHRNKLPLISFAAYNEPTLDPFFIDRLRLMKQMGFTYWWISNGSKMTEELVHFLITEKPRTTPLYLNLAASCPELLAQSVGITKTAAERSLSALERSLPTIIEAGYGVILKVHGEYNDEHRIRSEKMREWAHPLGATVEVCGVMDRAGMLTGIGKKVSHCNNAPLLCGASYLQNLYIGVKGNAYLCCHDYYQTTTYGEVTSSQNKLSSSAATYRNAKKKLKSNFCTHCEFAIDIRKHPFRALNILTRPLRRTLPLVLRKKMLQIFSNAEIVLLSMLVSLELAASKIDFDCELQPYMSKWWNTTQGITTRYSPEKMARLLSYVPWANNCLVKAIVIKRFLARRNIFAQLKIGASGTATTPHIHAWLDIGGKRFLYGGLPLSEFSRPTSLHGSHSL